LTERVDEARTLLRLTPIHPCNSPSESKCSELTRTAIDYPAEEVTIDKLFTVGAPMELKHRSHAVVIGGSIAGLCAARALSRHFQQVTLIERDLLPTGPAHRTGVPQSQHVHALLLRGLLELETLFPGIERELVAAGAHRMDLGSEFAHYTDWGWAPRAAIQVEPLTMSRIGLESVIRARLRHDLNNLSLLEDTRVTGLLTSHEGTRVKVTGVTTDRVESPELFADLVIDASGRNSKCLDWLAAHGVARPDTEVVDAFAGYASRFYELAPDDTRWWRGMLIDPKAPDQKRWALLMPVEDGRHVLTLGGLNRDYPPGDEEGFQTFLGSRPSTPTGRSTTGPGTSSAGRRRWAASSRSATAPSRSTPTMAKA
jgi:flavin-dependent dehydrogenase